MRCNCLPSNNGDPFSTCTCCKRCSGSTGLALCGSISRSSAHLKKQNSAHNFNRETFACTSELNVWRRSNWTRQHITSQCNKVTSHYLSATSLHNNYLSGHYLSTTSLHNNYLSGPGLYWGATHFPLWSFHKKMGFKKKWVFIKK